LTQLSQAVAALPLATGATGATGAGAVARKPSRTRRPASKA